MGAASYRQSGGTRARLRGAFVLTALILVVELVGAFFSHSLALYSDAGHVFTDLFALGLAWFATAQAERPSNEHKTYGYHRTSILAALANALALILIVFAIAYEAVLRLSHPQEVTPWIMFPAAAVALGVNLYIAFGLRHEHSANLNVRAALLHVLGDVGASAGVLVAGAIIVLTGWTWVDPVLSLLIALLIAWGAWKVLREAVEILMESTPRGLPMQDLVRDMLRQPDITAVHDLHVWSIAGGVLALSAHVQVRDRPLSTCDDLLRRLNALLETRYGIAHSTIQLECAECAANDLYCSLSPEGSSLHEHAHGSHALHRHEAGAPTDHTHAGV